MWCQGKVVSVVNENTNVVDIKWKEEVLSDIDQQTPIEKLIKTEYNPHKQMKGAWRQDLYKLLSTYL